MGTIKTTNIETITGSGTLTLGQSGETISVPSGATLDLSNATQTGVGGTNSPAFIVYNNSTQTISNSTHTTYQFNTITLDTDSGFNTGTYTYTVPTTGKYVIGAAAKKVTAGSTDRMILSLKINGSFVFYSENYSKDFSSVLFNVVFNLSATDTLQVAIFQNTGGNVDFESGNFVNIFYGHKLIGV